MRHLASWMILAALAALLAASQLVRLVDSAPAAEGAASRQPPLFADWPAPRVALVFTGSQDGYMEPCGCSGKENQKGGLSRRDMFLQSLAEKKWPVIPMDVGGIVKRFGKQTELKYQAMVDGLKMMGYKAIGFGSGDLRLSADVLAPLVTPVGDDPTPFVSANVGLYEFDEKIIPTIQVVEAGGKKIGVTSVLGDESRRDVTDKMILLKPASAALEEVLPRLQAAKCDFLVLLSNATLDESQALAKKFPQFDVVVSAGGADEPPAEAAMVAGTNTRLIEVGHKGMYAIVLGVYDNPNELRYQRVPLDARFGDSRRMVQIMAGLQDQLKYLGLDGLGLKPVKHPSGRTFVGSSVCGDCHTKAYAIWEQTPHKHALETLEKLTPSREFDAECLSCHVTGWEPQKSYPFVGGFLDANKTPLLAGNGCENCHGPGSAHVAAELGDAKASATDIEQFRKELRLSLATPESRRKAIDNCLHCHDIDNSIGFKNGDAFDEYWEQVKHSGKD
ncbi:MAG: hypothetical protein IT427_09210 [Pirellulales bacterium]|nr:hypothetical protein [Pirellulales bacterium]